MTIILVVVLVIMVLMNAAIFYVLWSAVGVTKRQVSSCFIKELEDYNDYLNDKKEECEQVEQKKDAIQKQISSLEGVMVSLKTSPFYAPKNIAHELFVPTARYIDNMFFDAHKYVNDKMSDIDYDDLIDRIREKYPYVGNLDLYNTVVSMLEGLSLEVTYQLNLLTEEQQVVTLREAFNDAQNKVFDQYLEENDDIQHFDILNLRTFLREIRTIHDPNMYVRVGSESQMKEPYENVIYQLDDNISEGIKIIFQNQNFDFSIYRLRSKK